MERLCSWWHWAFYLTRIHPPLLKHSHIGAMETTLYKSTSYIITMITLTQYIDMNPRVEPLEQIYEE